MSVLENLGKKISTTFENAQKDLRHSVAKSLSVAATTIATPSNKAQTAGNKTKLFSTILERSKRIRDHIIDHRNPTITERTPAAGITTSGGGVVARDDVQDKLATFARLEKEFSDLIEAYEILLVERVHLEEIMTGNSQLESLDDLELVGQYYKALQDATQISKQEIARLTVQVDELRQHDGSIAIECPQTQPMEECNNNDNLPGHQATESLLREAEGNIQVLKEQLYEKDCRITGLTTKGAERETRVTSLESQKMALETKVNYLQKQLQDMEGIKSKLKEVSNHSQGEVQQAKEELAKYKQRLALTESDLISTKRALEACQTELSLVRDELEASSSTLRDDNYRLGEALKAAEDLLGEEHAKCDDLFNQLAAANEQITQLQKMLTMKESELIRQSRATSVGSVRSPSLFSIEENGETIRRRPSNTTEHSLKALKGECERLAIENARLKATSQIEYIRNIILKYLQLPDQRKSLLPVLTNLFRFTDKELASIKK